METFNVSAICLKSFDPVWERHTRKQTISFQKEKYHFVFALLSSVKFPVLRVKLYFTQIDGF